LEHKHKALDTILNDAFAKGDIQGPQQLKFYVRQAMAHQNLMQYTDGYCAFTRLTGEQPRTPLDVAVMDQTPINLKNASVCDKAYIDQLQSFLRNMHLWTHCLNNERCKLDQAQKLTSQSKKCSTMFDFKVDDLVSYQGRAVTIVDLIDPCASGFMNAVIRRVDHDGAFEKQVKYEDLLPIGTLFPEKMLPASVPVHVGQFYFFEDPADPSMIAAGKLTLYDSNTEMCTLQTYVTRDKTNNRHYTPLWISPTGLHEYGRNKNAKSTPHLVVTPQCALRLQVPINSSGYIPQTSLHALKSHGVTF
jgi:hypothetical protein